MRDMQFSHDIARETIGLVLFEPRAQARPQISATGSRTTGQEVLGGLRWSSF